MKNIINIDGIDCQKNDATIGESVLDLSPVLKKNNAFFLDEGFMFTASCKSKITYLDGEKGTLIHRGYKIEDIIEKKSFLEVTYLILNGDFPSNDEFAKFKSDLLSVKLETKLLVNIADSLPNGNHPMATIMTLMSVLSGVRAPIRKTEDNYKKCLDVIRHMLFIVSIANCKFAGKKYEENNLEADFTSAFAMMNLDDKLSTNTDVLTCLDKVLSLHIDHEQNASTSTVRMIGSTKCDLYGSVTGGIAALWGPLHGGANEAVLKMLNEIGDESRIDGFVADVKNKVDGAKLMGFGHRVYKNYDPRAAAVKKYCDKLFESLNIADNKMLNIAKKLEQTALSDEYFISRKLFPNVDFYSGIIYNAIGVKTEMFTGMFALGRVVGWCAQWLEASKDEGKIWRPRQLYIGENGKNIA
ncbi:citrate/2-methylcitrate synthase [Candidatus Deianiraea vastatrix]|uniref:Citrate synthase n=1 Tax=Candidatus Deianiraea vastatrix TaxID=2163644 RepID=A0A5B8XFV1_9RICK|nr:citrate/2-methylcitrate synthase [Candidatus Deianiraea vastatrix]QED23141.1 Citrate synthase [Candidatus Deianiraea vastatrix]